MGGVEEEEECVCVCVCVCERERERERERVGGGGGREGWQRELSFPSSFLTKSVVCWSFGLLYYNDN